MALTNSGYFYFNHLDLFILKYPKYDHFLKRGRQTKPNLNHTLLKKKNDFKKKTLKIIFLKNK